MALQGGDDMGMTMEQLEAEQEKLREQQQQLQANLYAVSGALQYGERLLELMRQDVDKDTEES